MRYAFTDQSMQFPKWQCQAQPFVWLQRLTVSHGFVHGMGDEVCALKI